MISVIVVTYNRISLVKDCLESILSQDYAGEFEVIVIDNNSCDGTSKLFEDYPDPRVKGVRNETRKALSECRIAGLNLARGRIIAFTDDDCLVSKNWLCAISDSLGCFDLVSGPVLPAPGTRFPAWWRDSLNWMIGVNPKPGKNFPPMGSNIAFKKDTLEKVYRSNPEYLKHTTQYLPYREDYYLVKRALDLRLSLDINNNMAVYHRVPIDRMKVSYLLKRSFNEGKARLTYEKRPKNLVFSFLALPANAVRLVICGDVNRFFRVAENISYITNYLRKC